jgi:hypothetical protein
MSLVDSQKGMADLLAFNDECGFNYGAYSFSQGDSDVTVKVPLPENTTSRQVAVSIDTNTLSVGLKNGGAPILAGRLFKPIKAEDSTWCIEDKRTLVLTLVKSNREFEEWWPHVCAGQPQCDFKTLKPPSKHMRELDGGAQMQIQKMMLEQEQKRKAMAGKEHQFC